MANNGFTTEQSYELEQLERSYPFVSPLPAATPADVRQLIADVYIIYSDPAPQQLHIETVDPDSSNAVVRFIIHNADNTVFMDTDACTCVDFNSWGSWIVEEFIDGDKHFKVLLSADAVTALSVARTGLGLKLTARNVDVRAGRVKSITFKNSASNGDLTTVGVLTHKIILTGGYNTAFDDATDILSGVVQASAVRPMASKQINCSPGDGLGKYITCDPPEPVVRMINGIKGDTTLQNFTLSPHDCYWISPPASSGSLTPSTLALANDCSPCKKCDDYVNDYKKLRVLWERASKLRDRLLSVIGTYERTVTQFNQRRDVITAAMPTVELDLVPRYSRTFSVQIRVTTGDLGIVSGALTIAYSGTTCWYIDGSGYTKQAGVTKYLTRGFFGTSIAVSQRSATTSMWSWQMDTPFDVAIGTVVSVAVSGSLTMTDGSVIPVATTALVTIMGPYNKG